MRVRMNVTVSGTRDGESWPPKGGLIDLSQDEAEGLIANRIATAAKDDDEEPAEENAAAPAEEEKAVPAKPSTPRKPTK